MAGQGQETRNALLIMLLMLLTPLAGCFGEDGNVGGVNADNVLTIDGLPASDAVVRAGEFHELLLMGDGLRISAPAHDVLFFVNGSLDIDSSVPVDGDRILLKLLTTPYTETVELTIYDAEGNVIF